MKSRILVGILACLLFTHFSYAMTGVGNGNVADEAITTPALNTNGDTGVADDVIMVNPTDVTKFIFAAMPDCDDTGGKHLNYDTTTHLWSCGTSGDGGGGLSKEIFFEGHNRSTLGDYSVMKIDDDDDDDGNEGNFSFHVPYDMNSIVSLTLVVTMTSNKNSNCLDLKSDYAATGEHRSNHSETAYNVNVSITANNWTEIDITGVFSNLAAGDWAGLKIQNDCGKYMYFLGIRLKYN